MIKPGEPLVRITQRHSLWHIRLRQVARLVVANQIPDIEVSRTRSGVDHKRVATIRIGHVGQFRQAAVNAAAVSLVYPMLVPQRVVVQPIAGLLTCLGGIGCLRTLHAPERFR
jgi:hypothetical protein